MTSNAIIYVRVSTEEQASGYSLRSQLEACRAYAAQHGYTVLQEIEERHTGKELQRPGLQKLYTLIAADDVDIVLVYDSERLSRGGPTHHALIRTRLKAHNVDIVFVSLMEQESSDTLVDNLVKQSLGWYENQQRSQRVRNGKLNSAKAGNALPGARPPYGYDYAEDTLVVNNDEAPVVQKIYHWYLSGRSTREIAKRLSSASVPTKGDKIRALAKRNQYGVWNPSTVKKILHNEVYTGRWYYNKTKTVYENGRKRQEKRPQSEWVAVTVPAIISSAIYQQVQEQLAANREKLKNPQKRFYLLQGMLYCACGFCCSCDYRHEYLYYNCPRKPGHVWKRECAVRFVCEIGKVEQAVWRAITTFLADPVALQNALVQQRQHQESVLAEIAKQLDAIQAVRSDTERKLRLLLDHLLDGYPSEILQERKQLLLDTLRQLDVEKATVESFLPSITIVPEQAEKLLALSQHDSSVLLNLDPLQQREILELLHVRVDVINRQQLKISSTLEIAESIINIAQED